MDAIVGSNISYNLMGNVRVAVIQNQSDQRYFNHEITLSRLGHFVMDAHRYMSESSKRSKARPLILASLDHKTGRWWVRTERWCLPCLRPAHFFSGVFPPLAETYLVAGLWDEPGLKQDEVIQNPFGQVFERAVGRTEARVRMTSFDRSCKSTLGPERG